MSMDVPSVAGMDRPAVKPAKPVRESRFAALNRFFFAEEVPYGLALARMTLPVALLMNLGPRWMWAREIYSSDGAPSPLAENFGHFGFLPELPGAVAVALFTVLLFSLLTTAIGWCTRISLLLSVLLFSYFGLMDAMSTITKFSVIGVHLLFLLGMSNCGSIWSVDAWLAGRRGQSRSELRAPVWPQRLIQLLIGIIYLGAAVTKMHTPSYFSGDQLMYWMMTHVTGTSLLGDYLSQFPVLLVVFGYITVVWEIGFLFCIWHPGWRAFMLAIGVGFHIMTTLTLGLVIFPLVMFSAYLAFLTEKDMRRLTRVGLRLRRRVGPWLKLSPRVRPALPAMGTVDAAAVQPASVWASAGAFAVIGGLIALAGVEIEYWRDPYQLRGANGPLALREIDPAEVRRLLASDESLAMEDKFLGLDLGTTVVATHLLNHRTEFRQGESVCAQVSLNPPHEDLWVECNLYDSSMRLITRLGQIISRESLRGHFNYMLDESVAPGEYVFVVKCGGHDITRKSITLLPRAGAAPSTASMSAN